MENINAARLSSIEVVQVSDTTFALECNHKLYYIGAILFSVIQHVKAGKDFAEIRDLVAAEHRLILTREKFDHILDDTVGKILAQADAAQPRKQSYVYGQLRLAGERTLPLLTRRLDFLLRPAFGLPLLVAALLATGLFLWRLYEAQLLHLSARHGVTMILGGYAFFAVVGFFHELGHATAAARYKISPKEIGCGFYVVLPVLYTDVSRVWVLSKSRRILVNVAGIYFQLLVNILLVAAYELTRHLDSSLQYLIVSFFITNSTLALYSLNPFFRNDGYWIYSDLFAVPNLAGASQGYLLKCWQYVRRRGQMAFRTPGLSQRGEIALLVYSVGRLVVVSWFSYMAYSGFYHSFQETVDRLTHQGRFAHESFFESTIYLCKVVLICVLFLLLLYRALKPRVLHLWARLRGNLAAAEPAPVAAAS